jgi:hypothetical protein
MAGTGQAGIGRDAAATGRSEAPAVGGIAALAVDCADPAALAGFWARLLGGRAEADDDGVVQLRGPGLAIDFARVPEAKQVKNRLHLDLRSTDFDAAVEQALRLGATRADDIDDRGHWQVLRDPEGNEFCILRPGRDE